MFVRKTLTITKHLVRDDQRRKKYNIAKTHNKLKAKKILALVAIHYKGLKTGLRIKEKNPALVSLHYKGLQFGLHRGLQ